MSERFSRSFKDESILVSNASFFSPEGRVTNKPKTFISQVTHQSLDTMATGTARCVATHISPGIQSTWPWTESKFSYMVLQHRARTAMVTPIQGYKGRQDSGIRVQWVAFFPSWRAGSTNLTLMERKKSHLEDKGWGHQVEIYQGDVKGQVTMYQRNISCIIKGWYNCMVQSVQTWKDKRWNLFEATLIEGDQMSELSKQVLRSCGIP